MRDQKKNKEEIISKLLENQQKFLNKVVKANTANFNKILFPIIRASYPSVDMSSLISVQPMKFPHNIFDFHSQALRDAGIYCV